MLLCCACVYKKQHNIWKAAPFEQHLMQIINHHIYWRSCVIIFALYLHFGPKKRHLALKTHRKTPPSSLSHVVRTGNYRKIEANPNLCRRKKKTHLVSQPELMLGNVKLERFIVVLHKYLRPTCRWYTEECVLKIYWNIRTGVGWRRAHWPPPESRQVLIY